MNGPTLASVRPREANSKIQLSAYKFSMELTSSWPKVAEEELGGDYFCISCQIFGDISCTKNLYSVNQTAASQLARLPIDYANDATEMETPMSCEFASVRYKTGAPI